MSAQVSGTSPGCSGSMFFSRLAPEALLEHLDVAHQLAPAGCCRCCRCGYGALLVPGSGSSPSHFGFGCGDAVHGAHHALDDVARRSEVAPVVAVVEHVDRLAREDVLREQEQRHVRPAPRAVHREEAQAGRRQLNSAA